MSTRTTLVLGVIVSVCVAVIVISAPATARLAAAFSSMREGIVGRSGASQPFGDSGLFARFGLGDMARRTPIASIAAAVAAYAFLFLTGAVTMLLIPRNLGVMHAAYGHGVVANLRLFGIGTLTVLALVFLTVAGLFGSAMPPLSLLLPIGLLLAAWSGLVALALTVGERVNRWAGWGQPSPIIDLALGMLLVSTVRAIPIVGIVSLTLLGLLSVGVVVATRFGTGCAWSLDEYRALDEAARLPQAEGEAQA